MRARVAGFAPDGSPTAFWTPTTWHHVLETQGHTWRVDDDGVHVRGEDGPRRSPSSLVERVLERYEHDFRLAGDLFGVDIRLLLATATLESAGNPEAERREPHDFSFGLMQTLTKTTHAILSQTGWPEATGTPPSRWWLPSAPYPKGNLEDWRRFLFVPYNSICAACRYFELADSIFGCKGDPVLLYATYNAGSPKRAVEASWGLVNAAPALDGFVRFYGDACFSLGEKPR